ncbi:MAG: nucleotidyl transferase AbiEii/AbiGii toxin family protein [Minisyncoccales bacterium]|jgi:hypothetical protein
MLSLKQIEKQYPESLRLFKRGILREYLQYKILEIIFNSEFANKLSFLGGTALRLVYDNQRFSEDLDFDNFGLTEPEFKIMAEKIKLGLEAQSIKTQINVSAKGAYRCNVRFPDLLFGEGLSPHQGEKILIHIDTASHDFFYRPLEKVINKFDVFAEIFTTPPDILLSQKIFAIFNRKRAKGRDFYDLVFLMSFAKPNYDYLKVKIGVSDFDQLKAKLIKISQELDFEELVRDVQIFLFNPKDDKKIKLFLPYIKSLEMK